MRLKKKIITGLLILTSLFYWAQSGNTIVDSILSGGLYRHYRLYVPTVYTGAQARPLIFNLHGYTSNALQQQYYGNFMPIADTANFLMVVPDGTAIFGVPFWNAGITAQPNDVQFMNDLVDSLSFIYNIDMERIYSCGMSNGAIMSYYLACNLPNRIAAIASVAGTMFNPWYTCAPQRAVPVMEVHGTADSVVPYAGDTNFAPVDSVVKKWVQHNGCNTTPTTFSVPNTNTNDNSTAVNYKYSNGTNGSSVELYKVFGGSHSWPGAIPVFANTNQDFNASVEIWRFFRQYKLSQFLNNVGIQEQSLKAALRLYPNPCHESLIVDGMAGCDFTLFSMDGKQLGKTTLQTVIPVWQLEPGMYLLKASKDGQSAVFRFIRN